MELRCGSANCLVLKRLLRAAGGGVPLALLGVSFLWRECAVCPPLSSTGQMGSRVLYKCLIVVQ